MESAQAIHKKRKKHLVAGLWLLIAPTALLIIAILLFAIVNWIVAATAPPPVVNAPATSIQDGIAVVDDTPTELFGNGSVATTIINVILFLMGAVGTIAWLPGLIVGIVLLATMPPKPQS